MRGCEERTDKNNTVLLLLHYYYYEDQPDLQGGPSWVGCFLGYHSMNKKFVQSCSEFTVETCCYEKVLVNLCDNPEAPVSIISMRIGVLCFLPGRREQGFSSLIGIAAKKLTNSRVMKHLCNTRLVCIRHTESESTRSQTAPKPSALMLRTEGSQGNQANR